MRNNLHLHLNSTATCFDSNNSLCFKIIDKANTKFDLKNKEALQINWRKPNLNAKQNHLALSFSLQILSPLLVSVFVCFFLVFVFCASLLSTIFIISDLNYRHLLLSWLNFSIPSSYYNTPCITSFSFIYCLHYLYANYRHLLLS